MIITLDLKAIQLTFMTSIDKYTQANTWIIKKLIHVTNNGPYMFIWWPC